MNLRQPVSPDGLKGAIICILIWHGIFIVAGGAQIMVGWVTTPVVAFLAYKYFGRAKPDRLRMQMLAIDPEFKVTGSVTGVSGTGLYVDQGRRRMIVYNTRIPNGVRLHPLSALMSSEVFEDGGSITSTVRSSQVVGAVVGSAVLGGVGLVIGALSGEKRNANEVSRLSLGITVINPADPFIEIVFFDSNRPIKRSSQRGRDALDSVRRAHAAVSAMIHQEDRNAATMPQASGTVAFGEEAVGGMIADLQRLHELLKAGVIDEAEFKRLKAAAIVRAV